MFVECLRDRPLTYLQIFDAPHEMPDTAIINRLSKYCDVIHHRRGFFPFKGWENVHDGVRHYRVRIKSPIPNFMRFAKLFASLSLRESAAHVSPLSSNWSLR